MLSPHLKRLFSSQIFLFLLPVLLLSYLTYFQNYGNPSDVFWDENYHIASAQKYLNGIYFMEQHPPLGKLLIALGEKIVDANPVDNAFINTDYATDFPEEFSFAGYRFFPALLAWLTAPLLYLIFVLITGNPLRSSLFSFLYIFDNALIVHLRGAMLEGTLLFGIALTILLFLLILKNRDRYDRFTVCSLWFGVALGIVFTTKLLGLVIILLIPALLWKLFPDWRMIRRFLLLSGAGLALTYVAIWQIHFALGKNVNPSLPDAGYYQASPGYREILTARKTHSIFAFPIMIRDSLKFVRHYNRGTPRLDLCKVDENGSPFYFWPFGGRSINYRWETPNGQAHSYLYLQANPVVWWGAFLSVLLAIALLVSSLLAPERFAFRNPYLLLVFLGLYVSYMIAISRIDRVMYLYHYFTPLFFSFIVFALVFQELTRVGSFVLSEMGKTVSLLAFSLLLFASFEFYRPLTYYEPLSREQMERRSFFSLWELTCVNCEQKSTIVVPCRGS